MAIRIPSSDIADVIGAQGLPKTYAAMLAVLSILLIGRAALARRTAVAPVPPEPTDAAPAVRQVGWRTFGMVMNGALRRASCLTLEYMVSIVVAHRVHDLLPGRRAESPLIGCVPSAARCCCLAAVRPDSPHPAPGGIWPSLLALTVIPAAFARRRVGHPRWRAAGNLAVDHDGAAAAVHVRAWRPRRRS